MNNPTQTYYFTFGQAHAHDIDGIVYDRDIVVEVTAESYGAARKRFMKYFGTEWAFQYTEKPDMHFFPGGITQLPDELTSNL